jgi:probable rRNA maturation factor
VPLACEVFLDFGLSFDRLDSLVDLFTFVGNQEPSAPSGTWEVSVRLTDDGGICSLHERFFGDSTPTDVISFPSGDDREAVAGYLGDIVVSLETAAAQSGEGGHSPEREVAFLALHGFLHLCGHDDQTEEGRRAMHARQRLLLEAFEHDSGERW